MGIGLLAVLVAFFFLVLLVLGRAQIAKGSNTQVANGSVVLVIAAVLGALALGVIASLDGW